MGKQLDDIEPLFQSRGCIGGFFLRKLGEHLQISLGWHSKAVKSTPD
jgi:hypothetical protein